MKRYPTSRAPRGWGSRVYRLRWARVMRMYTHDGVMALPAHETGFRLFEGSQVLMVLHAWRELYGVADRRTVQKTVEVDPFAAVAGPRLATEGHSQAGREHPLLKFAQVFTDQLWFLLPQLGASCQEGFYLSSTSPGAVLGASALRQAGLEEAQHLEEAVGLEATSCGPVACAPG
jgi:hypothetical protein